MKKFRLFISITIFAFLSFVLINCKSAQKKEVVIEEKVEKIEEVVEEAPKPVVKKKLGVAEVNKFLSSLTADNFIKNKSQYSKSNYEKWEAKFTAQTDILEYLKNSIPKKYYLSLIGHADITGTNQINEKLSKKRAYYIKNKLTALGIPQDKISTNWKSNRELIDEDNPTSGANRRVDLRLVK